MPEARDRLLDAFRRHGPMTTADAARRARVGASTARNVVRKLCVDDWLHKVGEGENKGHKAPWIYDVVDTTERPKWFTELDAEVTP